MSYKDKALQKEANRIASQRRRDKQKGMTQGMTKEGMTGTENVIPYYNHELSVREILSLHSQRSEDQKERFPRIPLPFGEAYYEALEEQRYDSTL